MKASVNEGEGLGVEATPTMFVNGQKVDGALPMPKFAAFWIARWYRRVAPTHPAEATTEAPKPTPPPKHLLQRNDRHSGDMHLHWSTYNPPVPAEEIDLSTYPLLSRGKNRGELAVGNQIGRKLADRNPAYRAMLCVGLTDSSFSPGCTSKRPGDDVSATVDGRKIYRADVEKYYQNQTAGSDQQPVGEQATSLRLSILQELIDNEILMRRAEKLGLLATDEEVERKLNEIKSPYTKEQFDARLKEKKITPTISSATCAARSPSTRC